MLRLRAHLATPMPMKRCLAVLVFLGLTAAAHAETTNSKSEREILSYPLSMEKIEKTLKIMQGLKAREKDAAIQAFAVKADKVADDDDATPVVGRMIKLIDETPAVKSAVTANGMSVKDFVLTAVGTAYLGMSVAAEQAKPGSAKAAGATEANLALYKANEKRLREIGALMQKAEIHAPGSGDGE